MDTKKPSGKHLLTCEVSQLWGLAGGVLSGWEDGTKPSVPGCPQPWVIPGLQCWGSTQRGALCPGGVSPGQRGSAPDPEHHGVRAKSELFSN